MKRWILRGVVAVVALGLVALLVASFLPKPVQVEVARLSRGTVVQSVPGEGKTRVRERYQVAAPVPGELDRVEWNSGDWVRAGQVIARIRPLPSPLLDVRSRASAEARVRSARSGLGEANAAVKRARSAWALAQRNARRIRALANAGAVAPRGREEAEFELRARQTELEQARFAARRAAHELESAQAALGKFGSGEESGVGGSGSSEVVEVTAPIDGQLLRIRREDEGPVAAGTVLFELGDPRALEVVADVLSTDAVGLRPGMAVVLTEWGGQPALHGRVRVVEPAAFMRVSPLGVEEQRVNVRVDLEGDRAARVRLGDAYSVQARFVLSEAVEVLRIPVSAVFRTADGWATFVVEEGRARRRPVKVGRSDSEWFELLEGPGEGAQVIVHPGERVTDGVRVVTR